MKHDIQAFQVFYVLEDHIARSVNDKNNGQATLYTSWSIMYAERDQ